MKTLRICSICTHAFEGDSETATPICPRHNHPTPIPVAPAAPIAPKTVEDKPMITSTVVNDGGTPVNQVTVAFPNRKNAGQLRAEAANEAELAAAKEVAIAEIVEKLRGLPEKLFWEVYETKDRI